MADDRGDLSTLWRAGIHGSERLAPLATDASRSAELAACESGSLAVSIARVGGSGVIISGPCLVLKAARMPPNATRRASPRLSPRTQNCSTLGGSPYLVQAKLQHRRPRGPFSSAVRNFAAGTFGCFRLARVESSIFDIVSCITERLARKDLYASAEVICLSL